jgi:HK97 gp10 family phage protein
MAETVQGLKELSDALRALGPDIGRNALRAGVRAAAKLVSDDAKSRVPVKTGVLRKAIYFKQIRELSGDVQQTFFVAARSGKKYQKRGQDAYYWRFLELGTINIGATPFFRPAFDANKGAAVDAIATKIKQRIDKAQKR